MSYKFFQNKECPYFPCKKVDKLNCLFCFCPLYNMSNCGGYYVILKNGWKDCSNCTIIHKEDGYDYVVTLLKKSQGKKIIKDERKLIRSKMYARKRKKW